MDKFVLMWNSTSFIDHSPNVSRHYIVRSINPIRLFGFLWSQRKKCLLFQYTMWLFQTTTHLYSTVRAHARWSLGFRLCSYFEICISHNLRVFLFWLLPEISAMGIFKTIYIRPNAISLQQKQNKFPIRHLCVHVRLSHDNRESFLCYFLLCKIFTYLEKNKQCGSKNKKEFYSAVFFYWPLRAQLFISNGSILFFRSRCVLSSFISLFSFV